MTTTVDFLRTARKLQKSGESAAEAIERMAASFRALEASMGTVRLAFRRRRPKSVQVVTMDDGVTRKVVRW